MRPQAARPHVLCLQPPKRLASQAHSALRSVLATSVASAALLAYGVRPVRAAPPLNCTTDGTATIVTCTGDQSGGVLLNNGGGTSPSSTSTI